MAQSTSETIIFYLEKILDSVHPLMAEGIYLAAVPNWYNQELFTALRDQDDGRNEGLVERLTRYSFIMRWKEADSGEQTYAVRSEERMLIQRRWIAKEPEAYRAAHRRALAYWEANPDPNPFAQAQNRLYHRLFVDRDAATDYLVDRFRAYHNDRQLAAIERLLDTADKARFYLSLLEGVSQTGFDDLLIHLRARLAQLRGRWADSRESLQTLRQKESLAPGLQPYVTRAYGYALAHTDDYVGAIAEYEAALTVFQEQAAVPGSALADTATLEAEQAQTMIALGDAHVNLATSTRGPIGHELINLGRLRPLRHLLAFILSLPLVVYLSLYLGWRVWRPSFWPTLVNLDWIIARLFAVGARYYHRADPILEKYGDPGEGVAADEKLAYLYLALGDAGEAQSQFNRLLQEEEAPLGEYRQAAVRVGLGQAWLRQENYDAALDQLEQALPALQQFEDTVLEATARAALAETLYLSGSKTDAIAQFSQAAGLRQAQGNWVSATDMVERLEALIAADAVDEAVQEAATAVSHQLPQRQYAARFRHPALVALRRLTLLLLPVVLLLMPLLVIRLDTSSTLTPAIQFKAAPIFDPAQVVSSQLSQGVTTANVAAAAAATVIIWLAIALLAGYILLSLALGLLLIMLTPLRTLQEQRRAGTVHLDDEGIRIGDRRARWADVTALVQGDVKLWQRPLPDESAFALVTQQERLIIPGSSAWYESLRRRVGQALPEATRITDLDYAVFRSRKGQIYLINIILINVLALLAWLAPGPLWQDLPGIPYSVADLYPFFYLGLIGLPLWWLVVRPLQTHLHLNPHSRLPWYLLSAGLLLALFQTLTLFRPLLTAANFYPPLVTLILLAGAGVAIGRVKERGQSVYATPVRRGTAVLTAAIGLLMALLLWREIGAYHYLVVGNARRDRAQQVANVAEREEILSDAIGAYTQAIKIGATRILGIDVRAATRIPLGVPEPHGFTWLAALTNRAALQVQLGRYPEAIGSYNVILDYTDRPAKVYSWRAIARQSWSATDTGEEVEIVATQYELALADFDKAIKLRPHRADYYLWRGVAYHALSDLQNAWNDYETALTLTDRADVSLTDPQRERALTGQGWIKYGQQSYAAAQQLFRQATQANPEKAEAWVGLGYAAFSRQQFDKAETAWERAFALDPNDPTVLVSLGTLHWKLGGLTDDEAEKCDEYGQSAGFFVMATEQPGQEPKSLAFTYRTRGQVQFLLRNCPDRSFTDVMNAAIASYDAATALDPDNAAYWQVKGRLGYALWLSGEVEDETAVLLEALTAINEAYKRDANDRTTVNFRNAILRALEPLLPADAADKFNDGDYDALLDALGLLQEQDPATFFSDGLAALQTGDVPAAMTLYQNGLDWAIRQERLAAVGTAVSDLLPLPADQTARIYPLFEGAFPQLGQVGEGDERVETAVTLGLIATALEEYDDAALWFNEAIRRTFLDNSQYGQLRQSRNNLRAMWIVTGVNSDEILRAIRAQLPEQLRAYPELAGEGFYWRYRAWFKYGLGLSAFRLSAETAAAAALKSAQADADQAYAINAGSQTYAKTYLEEAAWGWYHLERGDDFYAAGDFKAALDDYENAADLIQPAANSDAGSEATLAAFKSGLTAVQLADFEGAADWYAAGLERAVRFDAPDQVENARDELLTVQAARSELADEIEELLGILSE